MEGVFKGDDGGPARVRAGDFDGVFHGFRAAVGQNRFLGKVARRVVVQPLGDFDVAFIRRHHEAGMQ